MQNRALKYIIIFSCFLTLSACSWFSSDDAFKPADLIDIENPMNIDEKWSTGVGRGSGDQSLGLSPYIADNKIFIADYQGLVTAVDLKTGNELWDKNLDLPISAGPSGYDNTLIVGTLDGEVIAQNIENGEQLWKHQVSSEILSAPVISEGIVVVHTVDGKLYGLSLRDGEQLWKYERDVPSLSLRGTSKPIIDKSVVIAGMSGGKLVALSLDKGYALWEVIVAPPSGTSELDRIADIDGDPILTDGVLYVASFQGIVLAINGRTGKNQWKRKIATSKNMAVDLVALYVVNKKDEIFALDLDSGETLWKQDQLLYRKLSPPATINNMVVVGDLDGYLHFLDQDSGKIIARKHASSDPITAQPQVIDQQLYVFSSDGELIAFDMADLDK